MDPNDHRLCLLNERLTRLESRLDQMERNDRSKPIGATHQNWVTAGQPIASWAPELRATIDSIATVLHDNDFGDAAKWLRQVASPGG